MTEAKAPRRPSFYNQFATDPEKEKNGIELEYVQPDNAPSVVIRIARAGGANTRFNKVLEAKSKPYRRLIQNEVMPPEQMDTIFREVYAEAVVLGWENVTDENGEPMPFTRENCVKLFKDLPALFEDVQAQANKQALFRKDELDAAVKN